MTVLWLIACAASGLVGFTLASILAAGAREDRAAGRDLGGDKS